MKGKKKLSAILVTLMLIISVFMVAQFPVYAQGGATLVMRYGTGFPPSKDIGSWTLVQIRINTTEKVHSWNVSFSYDPAILQYNFAVEGDFLKQNGTGTALTQGTPGVGQVVGLYCTHGGSNYTQGSGDPTLANQTLASLNFTILDYGKSALTFIQGKCKVEDPTPTPITPLTFIDGYWETRALVTIALPTVSWIYPSKKIGENITMALTIDTVEKVTSWTTGIRFDNNTIKFISVTEGPFLSQNGTTNFVSGTDHNNGTVSGISCAHTVNYTKGQGILEVLATFKFQILAYGKTAIELTDLPGDLCETIVLDQNGDECSLLSLVDGSWELRVVVNVKLEDVYETTATNSIGGYFTVDLTINTTEKVSAWQGGIRFDNTIVNCVNVIYGTYLSSVGTTYPMTPTINNTAGMIYGMGETLTGGAYNTGAGLLATINFTILDYGKTTLDLTDLDLDPCEFTATDEKGDELTVLSLVDGSYEFRAGVTFGFTFLNTIPSIGTPLVVDLKIYTPEKVSAWQGGFRFNSSVLNCTAITYGSFLSNVGSTYPLPYTINNTAGTVSGMGETLLGDLKATVPIQGAILATITFNVTGPGWNLITLNVSDPDPSLRVIVVDPGYASPFIIVVNGGRLKGDANSNGVVEMDDVMFEFGPRLPTHYAYW